MRASNALPSRQKRQILRCLLLTCASILISPHALAQQQSSSGAVETFEPVFDVGVMHEPPVGQYGITQLMVSAAADDLARVDALLGSGAVVNAQDDSGVTALLGASVYGSKAVVERLLAAGADPDIADNKGDTPLSMAIRYKNTDVAVAILENGADPNVYHDASYPASRKSVLVNAAVTGQTEVVRLLIDSGVDVNEGGIEALNSSLWQHHEDVAALLIETNININAPTYDVEKHGRMQTGERVLQTAAQQGLESSVELLLRKGANINDRNVQGQSALHFAVSEDHRAVVTLLTNNGALPTAKTVLAVMQKGYGEAAVVLMKRLDLENTEVAVIESLIKAADDLKNDELTTLFLNSASARSIIDETEQAAAATRQASAREHSRLLFAQQVEDHCVVGVWDSRSDTRTELANIAECPDEIFVSKDHRSAFIVDGASIRIVSIDKSAADVEVALPVLDYRGWIDQMTPRPDQNPDYLPSMTGMIPNRISVLDDGSLAVVLSLWMPADDEFHYLLRHDNGQWSMTEGQWCHRWGCEKALGPLTSKSTRGWPESRMIWHAALKFNPFLSRQSIEMVDLEYESYQGTIHQREFEIDGVSTLLSAYTRPSEHSDTLHTLGISLTIDSQPPIELSGNQCLTSIVGRYILVYEFFQGRFEVTDLGTGRRLIGDLKTALWLD